MSFEAANVKGHWLLESGYNFCPHCGQHLQLTRLLVDTREINAIYKMVNGEIDIYEDFVRCDNEKCVVGPTIIRDLKDPG